MSTDPRPLYLTHDALTHDPLPTLPTIHWPTTYWLIDPQPADPWSNDPGATDPITDWPLIHDPLSHLTHNPTTHRLLAHWSTTHWPTTYWPSDPWPSDPRPTWPTTYWPMIHWPTDLLIASLTQRCPRDVNLRDWDKTECWDQENIFANDTTHPYCGGSRHRSTFGLYWRVWSLVCATFIGFSLSLIAFFKSAINLSCIAMSWQTCHPQSSSTP